MNWRWRRLSASSLLGELRPYTISARNALPFVCVLLVVIQGFNLGWKLLERKEDVAPPSPRSFPRRVKNLTHYATPDDTATLIIVVTPTILRPERVPEMMRLAYTLMFVDHLLWVVVEDGNETSPLVEKVLQRTGHPFVYFAHPTPPGRKHSRGWPQRDAAIKFIRRSFAHATRNSVVYFADDDNTYDIRLFDRYIRRVRRIGVWGVGLSGKSLIEAPDVDDGKVVGWLTNYAPKREFGVDMAGFALNTRELLTKPDVLFEPCKASIPENCFLYALGLRRDDAEPFGHDDDPKEILVWHTQSRKRSVKGESLGYEIEMWPWHVSPTTKQTTTKETTIAPTKIARPANRLAAQNSTVFSQ